MTLDFNSAIPIYLQIIDSIKQMILAGQLIPGEKIPSVRELALDAQVNPNTMQKALSELERDGILYTERTTGRYVTKDEKILQALKKQHPQKIVAQFITDMIALGLNRTEIIAMLNEELKGNE